MRSPFFLSWRPAIIYPEKEPNLWSCSADDEKHSHVLSQVPSLLHILLRLLLLFSIRLSSPLVNILIVGCDVAASYLATRRCL